MTRRNRLSRCVALAGATLVSSLSLTTMLVGIGAPASAPAAAASWPSADLTGIDTSATPTNFWLASAAGNIWTFGTALYFGAPATEPLAHPIVAMTPTKDGGGYWSVGSDGGVFSYGDAPFLGSTGNLHLVQPIVGIAPTPDGKGYWLVASDGGIFSFGDATFSGSTGAIHLVQPIVAMAATPDGKGYWLVASDGGIFSFGDAGFYGSMGGKALSQPIVSMASTPDGRGYWLLAADGGVFNFGDAGFYGSTGASPDPDPAEHLVPTRSGGGYWIVDQNGTAYDFGSATGAPPTQALLFDPVTPGDKAILFAFYQLGKPYIWGGNGPTGYDCSGLALAAWQHGAGVSFARVSNDQYDTAGVPVSFGDLQAGDLVFWATDPTDWTTVDHTAMYVGGDRIVESTGDHVQLNSLDQWGADGLMTTARRP